MDPIPFWVRKNDLHSLEQVWPRKSDLLVRSYEHFPDTMIGLLVQTGALGKIGQDFVLGKVTAWDERPDARQLHVRIAKGPLHPRGAVLTAYSWIHVAIEKRKSTVDRKEGIDREEFAEHPSFVGRAFRTYYERLLCGRVKKGYDPHLFLYDPDHLLEGRHHGKELPFNFVNDHHTYTGK